MRISGTLILVDREYLTAHTVARDYTLRSQALDKMWARASGKNVRITSEVIKYLDSACGGPFNQSRQSTLALR